MHLRPRPRQAAGAGGSGETPAPPMSTKLSASRVHPIAEDGDCIVASFLMGSEEQRNYDTVQAFRLEASRRVEAQVDPDKLLAEYKIHALACAPTRMTADNLKKKLVKFIAAPSKWDDTLGEMVLSLLCFVFRVELMVFDRVTGAELPYIPSELIPKFAPEAAVADAITDAVHVSLHALIHDKHRDHYDVYRPA